jgi:hypothetical protein
MIVSKFLKENHQKTISFKDNEKYHFGKVFSNSVSSDNFLFIGIDHEDNVWYFDEYESRIQSVFFSDFEKAFREKVENPKNGISGLLKVEPLLNVYKYPYSDIDIMMEDSYTEVQFKLHKGILAVQSEYFQSTFQKFEETCVNKKYSIRIKSTGYILYEFQLFVKYLYGIEIFIDKTNIFSMLNISTVFGCETLKEECLKFIKNNISFDWLPILIFKYDSYPIIHSILFKWFDKVWTVLIQTNVYEDYCKNKQFESVFLSYLKMKNKK